MIGDRKQAVVNQQIPCDFTDSGLTNLSQQLPDPLCYQEGIATATNQQIAVKNFAINFTQRENIGRPAVSRPENIQRHQSREQLDRRTGVAWHVFLPAQQRLALIEVFDIKEKVQKK